MNNFEEIFDEIKKYDSFYLSGHKNPDGDSIGSCKCIQLALESLGSEVVMGSGVPVPGILNKVPASGTPDPMSTSDPKVFIQLDVQADYRIPDEALVAKQKAKVKICFDHHQPNEANCDLVYVDPSAAANALIIWDFVKFMNVKITKEIATAAYFGLCSDTNSFMNSNSDQRAFEAATEMISYGVDASKVAQELFQSRTLQSFNLEKVALDHMFVDEDKHFAFTFLTAEDYAKYNATKADSDAIIDLLRKLECVEVACMIRQEEPGQKVRGSLRSKGNIDVSKLARQHTGGGHKAASGFTMDETDITRACETVKLQLLDLMNGKF